MYLYTFHPLNSVILQFSLSFTKTQLLHYKVFVFICVKNVPLLCPSIPLEPEKQVQPLSEESYSEFEVSYVPQ